MFQDNQATQFERFTQGGPMEQGVIPMYPVTGVLTPKERKYYNTAAHMVENMNANRDMNETHDFDYWMVQDRELEDYAAFNAIHNKVLANRQKFNSFLGDKDFDYNNLSEAEIQYYEDFWGSSKKAAQAVGKAVGHAGSAIGKTVAKGAVDVAHLGRDAGVGIAHGARTVGSAVGRGSLWAVENGLSAAEAIASGALGSILGQQQPDLPPDFGSGGEATGPSGFGMGDPGDDDLDDDTGQGLSQQQLAQMAAQRSQQDQADQSAEETKHKMILYGGIAIAVLLAIYLLKRK